MQFRHEKSAQDYVTKLKERIEAPHVYLDVVSQRKFIVYRDRRGRPHLANLSACSTKDPVELGTFGKKAEQPNRQS